jgi:hypothetical protein
MTRATRFVAVVAVLAALALCVPVQAQTPAADALRVRAEAGDAVAQYNLGVSYANGRGVPQDDAEAVRWYRLAADQAELGSGVQSGTPAAQHALAVMHRDGRGVPQDDVEAIRWLELAEFNALKRLQKRGTFPLAPGARKRLQELGEQLGADPDESK